MSNIKNDPNYDPFPKTGLVRQFKNAILGELTLFLKKYPKVSKQDALFKFVELAIDAEKRFKPELSYSFWTFCRPYLKGAFRELVDKERKYDQGLIHKVLIRASSQTPSAPPRTKATQSSRPEKTALTTLQKKPSALSRRGCCTRS